jgi:hypothetical protein
LGIASEVHLIGEHVRADFDILSLKVNSAGQRVPSLRLRQWRLLRLEVFCRNCLSLLRSLPLRNKCIPFALKIIEYKIAVGDTVSAKVAQALTQLTPRHDHDVAALK